MTHTAEEIIHQFQLAHSLHCNNQARYQIAKLCKVAENKEALKWNELGHWLRNNPDATVGEIQKVRDILDKGNNNGKGIRGLRVREELA